MLTKLARRILLRRDHKLFRGLYSTGDPLMRNSVEAARLLIERTGKIGLFTEADIRLLAAEIITSFGIKSVKCHRCGSFELETYFTCKGCNYYTIGEVNEV